MTKLPTRPPFSSLLPLFLLLLVLGLAPAAAVPVDQIPNPRSTGGWAVDLTGTLSSSTLAELNQLGDEVKAQAGGGELAVVVIGSTDGIVPRDYATQLFNLWGIGDAEHERGVLVFAALDDRKAEIILGRGLQGPDYVQVSEGIMQGDMVPYFRLGDSAQAIQQGAVACALQLFGVLPTAAQPTPPPAPAPAPAPEPSPERIVVGDPYPLPDTHQLSRAPSEGQVAKLVLLGGILLLLLSFALPSFLRYRPRKCPRCQTKMTRLDEEKDNAYLEDPERLEEKIGSVDYDIWLCPSCAETIKLRHDRYGSGYSLCPDCGARTVSETSSVLSEPTYHRSGEVRVDERCVHCSYHVYSTHSTPPLRRPDYDDDHRYSSSSAASSRSVHSLSASSSSGWSSSSSSSSSSSNSSSSGGSFGGGSSSGSGASGSW